MIAHCGVFNLESMYGATEELFFVNWDLGGPYWKSDEIQSQISPILPHRFMRELENATLGDPRSERFSRPRHAGHGSLHGCSSPGCAIAVSVFPRRRTLGNETTKRCTLASRIF